MINKKSMERVITAEGPRVKRKRSVVYPSVWVCTGVCRCVPVCSLRTSAAAAGSSERFCTWPSQQVLPTSSSTSFSDCFTTLGADSLLQLNILAFNCCCRPPPPACSCSSSSSPHPPTVSWPTPSLLLLLLLLRQPLAPFVCLLLLSFRAVFNWKCVTLWLKKAAAFSSSPLSIETENFSEIPVENQHLLAQLRN